MKGRGCADDDRIELILLNRGFPVASHRNPVFRGHGIEQLRVGVAASHDRPPRGLETTEMSFTNAAATDHQRVVFSHCRVLLTSARRRAPALGWKPHYFALARCVYTRMSGAA